MIKHEKTKIKKTKFPVKFEKLTDCKRNSLSSYSMLNLRGLVQRLQVTSIYKIAQRD